MHLTKSLEWRYATKKFDENKTVDPSDIEKIKQAISLSASSYGLQSYKVIAVSDQATRAKLAEHCWGQKQVAQAPIVFVFAAIKRVDDAYIDGFISLKSKVQSVPEENLKGYGDFMKQTLGNFSDEQQHIWSSKQCYIALSNLLSACAELKIDACPMEGFLSDKFDEILGLSEKGLTSVVIAPVGYRADDDQTAHAKKVRKPLEELFVEV